MLASELKGKYLKKSAREKVAVVGHLSAVTEGKNDLRYHIHDNEEIPANVGVSFHIYPQYADQWRDGEGINWGKNV
jgi:hypothetical protein